jgi:glutamate-1-semialdehyde aminotransferase
VDGNEYVDFTIGFGVHFFGHRPPFVVKAVEEQLRRGFHLGPQSDLAGPVAKLFRELTGMERVTFCNTGSEAIMTALRIARTVTGRDRIAMFDGSYHGCFDGILARRAGGTDEEPKSRPVAPGTPQGMIDDVVVLRWWSRCRTATPSSTRASSCARCATSPGRTGRRWSSTR